MKIYDYTKFTQCFLGPSIDGRLDEIINLINDGLKHRMAKKIHPKEIERIERLKKRERENDLRGPFDLVGRPIAQEERALKESKKNQRYFDYKDCVLIFAGSCGFGTKDFEYFNKKFSEFNEALVKDNVHILFVRGNNDDPSYFDEEKINFSNIKTLVSNCLVKFNGYSCLCIGGGISFDREWKKAKAKEYGTTMYWENEGTNFDIKEISDAIKENNIACVISHEIPTFVMPGTGSFKTNRWFKNNSELLSDAIESRTKMDAVYNEFVKADKKPYVWWHTYSDDTNKCSINDIYFKCCNYVESLNQIVQSHFNKYLTEEENKPYSKFVSEWASIKYEDLLWETTTEPNDPEIERPVEEEGIRPAAVHGVAANPMQQIAENERLVQYNRADVAEVYNRIVQARENNEGAGMAANYAVIDYGDPIFEFRHNDGVAMAHAEMNMAARGEGAE